MMVLRPRSQIRQRLLLMSKELHKGQCGVDSKQIGRIEGEGRAHASGRLTVFRGRGDKR